MTVCRGRTETVETPTWKSGADEELVLRGEGRKSQTREERKNPFLEGSRRSGWGL